jgi:glycerate dehydrogenase
MKIVVLDGYTLNPGDLDWSELMAVGQTVIHDRTPAEQTVARASGAAVVLTNKTVLNAATVAALPALRYIGVLATGYNVVDIEATRRRGIPVTNIPAYATTAVTQMVFAHVCNLTLHVGEHAASVRSGEWSASADFCYWKTPLVELAGLTMGLVGYGRIGAAVASVATAFGMQVIAYDPQRPANAPGVRFVDLDTVFQQSDVVTLHCPLNEHTMGVVDARRLALMKPTAYLINTGRGPLIDEKALAAALHAKRLAGAGLDVLSIEPPRPDNPLLTAPNCYITPHIAWATRAARARLLRVAVENVKAFLSGHPRNVVNGVV